MGHSSLTHPPFILHTHALCVLVAWISRVQLFFFWRARRSDAHRFSPAASSHRRPCHLDFICAVLSHSPAIVDGSSVGSGAASENLSRSVSARATNHSHELVQEKESKVKEGMTMMGLARAVYFFGYWASSTLVALIPVAVISVLARLLLSIHPVCLTALIQCFFYSFSCAVWWRNILFLVLFPPSSLCLCLCSSFFLCFLPLLFLSLGLLLFIPFILFVQTLILFGMIVSCFFQKAKTAGTVSSFTLLFLFLPYFALSSSTSLLGRVLAGLSSPIAFLDALNALFVSDMMGSSVFFTLSATSEFDLSLRFTVDTIVLLFDLALYLILLLYFDAVLPGQWGTSRPWNFCCSSSFWCCCPAGSITWSGLRRRMPPIASFTSNSILLQDAVMESGDNNPTASAAAARLQPQLPLDVDPANAASSASALSFPPSSSSAFSPFVDVEPVSRELAALERVRLDNVRKIFTSTSSLSSFSSQSPCSCACLSGRRRHDEHAADSSGGECDCESNAWDCCRSSRQVKKNADIVALDGLSLTLYEVCQSTTRT